MDDLGLTRDASPAGASLLVGRQPMLDRDGKLAGYEIRVSGAADVGVEALLAAAADLGRRRPGAEHVVLIECTPELASPAALEVIRAHGIWLGVGARLLADPRAAATLPAEAAGLSLVVDDPSEDPALGALASRAALLRLRGGASPGAGTAAAVARLRVGGRQVLVTDVDDPDDRRRAFDAGADLVQGSALTTAERRHGAAVSPEVSGLVRLLSLLASERPELHELVGVVKANVTLSFQLLRLANAAAVGMRMPVDSVDRAVALLGPPTLRQLAPLLLVRSGRQVPEELTRAAMVRARTCQHLAVALGDTRPVHHTVGMLSTLDVIVGLPLPEVIADLPIGDEVRAALLRREGLAGRVLAAVEHHERFDWDDPVFSALDPRVVADCYVRAVRDADAILARFADEATPTVVPEPLHR